MRRPRGPVFLERRSYRQRRLRDAARMLPLLGAVLWMLPLLFGMDGENPKTSEAMLYLFGVWVVMAIAALGLSLRLETEPGPGDEASLEDEEAA